MKSPTKEFERLPIPRPSLVTQVQRDWQYIASCSCAAARKFISFEQAMRFCALPLATWREEGNDILTVLVPAPIGETLRAELRFVTACDVILEEGDRTLIERAIQLAYAGSDEHFLEKQRAAAREEHLPGSLDSANETHSEAPVPLLLEALLERADALSASDIHLEPQGDNLQLRFRVDGRLQRDTAFTVSRHVGENLFRRIKLLAGLDTTCNFRPQEGGFSHSLHRRDLRLRVSFLAQHQGEKAVIRLLENEILAERPKDKSTLQMLGMPPDQEQTFLAHLGANSGAIILSGPTGSGKSTLLYAAIEHLNAEWRNIITIEDPVERVIRGVCQLEAKKGKTGEMIPLLLRQDPDVLMIGEVRDGETAQAALSAAITGHLVLTTVHAGNTLEIFSRLLQLGVKHQLLTSSLRLLVSQRLLPLNCAHCSQEEVIPEGMREAFRLGNEPCLSGKGCPVCRGSGIRGRIGVYEFLPISTRIREFLWASTGTSISLPELSKLAALEGMRPLMVQVRHHVLRGDVSLANALRILGIDPAVALKMLESQGLSSDMALTHSRRFRP